MTLEEFIPQNAYTQDLVRDFASLDTLYGTPDYGKAISEHPDALVTTYAFDLIGNADRAQINLDLTHESVRKIVPALAASYTALRKGAGKSPADARSLLARQLSAYLMLLACNENGCHLCIHVFETPDELKQCCIGFDLWAHRIGVTIGKDIRVDLLDACKQAIQDAAPLSGSGGFGFNPSLVAVKYAQATGVNLLELGLIPTIFHM